MTGRASGTSWFDAEEVARAAEDCEVRKRRRPEAIAFRARLGEEILSLEQRLRTGRYCPEPGTVFVTQYPKFREVHAAAYRDRVAQHLLHRRLGPRLERSFISDSFACRPGQDIAKVARRRGAPELFDRVPPHKRLGAAGVDRGLPIGNLTSQTLANLYLGALDSYVKRTLGARSYVRYVDDFVLLHHDEATLLRWEQQIRVFLHERLKLKAHPVPRLRTVNEGIDFVGYVIRPSYLLPRRRVVVGFRRRLAEREAPLRPRKLNSDVSTTLPGLGNLAGPCSVWKIDEAAIMSLRATWASYEGHLRHASAHGLTLGLQAEHPISAKVLKRSGSRLALRFEVVRPMQSYREQVRSLSVGAAGALLLVQVGHYLECPRSRDAQRLGLHFRKQGRRRVGAGVPLALGASMIQRALSRGFSVVVAMEGPGSSGNVRQRSVRWLIEPVGTVGVNARRGKHAK